MPIDVPVCAERKQTQTDQDTSQQNSQQAKRDIRRLYFGYCCWLAFCHFKIVYLELKITAIALTFLQNQYGKLLIK